MEYRNIERPLLSLVLIILLVTVATHSRYVIQAMGTTDDRSILNKIPKVSCIYQGKEYDTLTPFKFNDGQRLIQVGFQAVADNIMPQMTVQEGKTITMKFDKNPTRVEVLLIDYDGDVSVGFPLKEIRKNTFELTPGGIKTLEVRALFPGNEQAFYSTLIDVKKS